MIRFLFLLGLMYVLYRLVFGPPFRISFLTTSAKSKAKKKPRHPDAEEMVPCANCGTFLSKREADGRGGRYYCKPKCHV